MWRGYGSRGCEEPQNIKIKYGKPKNKTGPHSVEAARFCIRYLSKSTSSYF